MEAYFNTKTAGRLQRRREERLSQLTLSLISFFIHYLTYIYDFQDSVIQGEVLSGKITVMIFKRENVLFSSILVLTFMLTSVTFTVSKKISPLMIVLRLDGPVAQY